MWHEWNPNTGDMVRIICKPCDVMRAGLIKGECIENILPNGHCFADIMPKMHQALVLCILHAPFPSNDDVIIIHYFDDKFASG